MTLNGDLTWFGWLYLILAAVGALWAITEIGKQREPRTPIDVASQIVVQGFFIWGIFFVGAVR